MLLASVFKRKKIMVFGLGITGISVAKALSSGGADVIAWDNTPASVNNLKNMNLKNVSFKNFEEVDWSGIDLLVLSPGVPLTHPKPHPIVAFAKKVSCPVICDIEILYYQVPEAFYIGITGTNGKTTVTALLGEIFQNNEIPTRVGGNIGISATDFDSLGKTGVYILEMSSYQLDLIDKTRFNISILLNISPDHLERHGGIDGYIKAKTNIYKNQGIEDIAIVGIDTEYSFSVYKNLKKNKNLKKIIPVSSLEFQKGGVSVSDGVLFNDIDGVGTKISLNNIKLRGKHNFQNIAAAFACAYLYGIDEESVINSINKFSSVRHRMQFLGKIGNVEFINDSKATNCSSAYASLAEYDNIFWIAGGINKEGDDINSLSEFFKKIEKAFLFGKAKEEFGSALEGKVDYVFCNDLDEAFKLSCEDAFSRPEKDSVVILAPACSSFDQWKNFEERGNYFCDLVAKLRKS